MMTAITWQRSGDRRVWVAGAPVGELLIVTMGGVELCDHRALASLRWHWGSAYLISHPEPGVWVAVRRDTRETLRQQPKDPAGGDPGRLARPVPRGLRGS